MKKAKIILATTLMLLMCASSVAYAASISKKEDVRGEDYYKIYQGSESRFYAAGTGSVAYTTLTNEASWMVHLSVYVREFIYDEGWGALSGDARYRNFGYQVTSGGISRNRSSYVRYYLHVGTCQENPNYPSVYDSYTYKANQYYED